MAIGGGLGRQLDRGNRAGAGAILDRDRLPPSWSESIGQLSSEHVDAASDRIGDDDADRLHRKRWRL